MKRCPYCGEEIQNLAKKCRFCGEWLNDKNENLIGDEPQKKDSEAKILYIKDKVSPLDKRLEQPDVDFKVILTVIGIIGTAAFILWVSCR